MSEVVELTKALVQIPSITPFDEGCQTLIKKRLFTLGFKGTDIPYEQTQNCWMRRGNHAPVFVFAGHTDVVSAGEESRWHYSPFTPTIRDGYLFGRGTADMKGGLAAMIIATERFIQAHPNHSGSIAFLLTSAEEGPAATGTPQVLKYLEETKQQIDYCIVGEPTCTAHMGDTIKNGRRGSLSCDIIFHGKQGHVAYPQRANNAIHLATSFFNALLTTMWEDTPYPDYEPTSLQIVNISGGYGSTNVIPGELTAQFNFRYSPALSAEFIQDTVNQLLEKLNIHATLNWTHYAEPFYTSLGKLTALAQNIIESTCGIKPELSTSGGTSDARYIAKYCKQVIELGLVNTTIHQVNECTAIADLEKLVDIYYRFLVDILK